MVGDIDWPHIALQAGTSLLSAIGGLLVGVWRWGRASAEREQQMKDEFDAKVDALGDQLKASMAEVEKAGARRLDLLVEQFKESFAGLRRQIDDDRLYTEQRFMRKEEFKDFREEYREDMREVKASIGAIGKK